MSDDIRVYVADLAAYNSGYLHGVWVDLTEDLNEVWEQINRMLKASPVEEVAEEFAIHDYEGFNGYSLGEYEGIEKAHEIAEFIGGHSEIGGEILDRFCGDIEEATKAMEESYCGCHKSVADYAQELTEETSDIPAHLEYYIDYEKMGNVMEMNGEIYTIETSFEEVHIFWNN